jgi:hypothetical protein
MQRYFDATQITGFDHSNRQRSSLSPSWQMGGQGGKVSLANTADADILEYILTKLAARIAAKARTFLVKAFRSKHTGENR